MRMPSCKLSETQTAVLAGAFRGARFGAAIGVLGAVAAASPGIAGLATGTVVVKGSALLWAAGVGGGLGALAGGIRGCLRQRHLEREFAAVFGLDAKSGGA